MLTDSGRCTSRCMRKVKQVDLAMADGEKDPVRRAQARELAHRVIEAIEARIEEEMDDG